MQLNDGAAKKVFAPLYPALIYLFLSITTLHETIPLLLRIHIELLTLLWLLLCSGIDFFKKADTRFVMERPLYAVTLMGLFYITAPLLSSLINQDHLIILKNDEFKTLAKMIIFGPFLFWQIHQTKNKKIIINSMVFFYAILAVYFLYRYLILNEVREFDLRPLLKIRHGDPNFLSTFFSMLIPISFMQIYHYARKPYFNLGLIFHSLASALLLICVMLTESRMGILATFIALIYLLLTPIGRHFNRIKMFSGFFAVALVILFISGERIVSRFEDIQDKSNSDRLLTLKNGAVIFLNNPLFGVGAHKARESFYANTTYPHFQSDSTQLDIHNTFLKALAELGIVGLMLCAFLFCYSWKTACHLQNIHRYFLLASMTSLTLSMMTLGILYKDLFILHLFFIAALATSEKDSQS